MTTNLEVPTMNASGNFALKAGWLEAKTSHNATGMASIGSAANRLGSSTTTTSGLAYYQTAWYPSQWYYGPTADRRPIRLGMSEVEKLRSAAKRDAKLKKILEKFTDQVEVTVDFK